MKVRPIARYKDLVENEIKEPGGDVFEVDDERGKKLIQRGFVEEVHEKPEEPNRKGKGKDKDKDKKEEPAAVPEESPEETA